MPINYVPSWWEQYAPQIQQGLSGITEGIFNKFAPDLQAQQTFRQLAMQNPSLVSEVANMDDGERQVFAKTLGAKNKDPFKNIGVGSKRKEREKLAAEEATLTPDQKAGFIAGKFNTKTQEEIDADRTNRERQGITFNLTKRKLEQDISSGDLELDNARIKKEKYQEAMKVLGGADQNTISELADSIVYRKKFKGDPRIAQAIQSDPASAAVLKMYTDAASDELRIKSAKDLKQLKGPEEKMWAFQFLKDEADNSRAALAQANNNLAKINPLMIMDANGQAQYDQARAAVAEAERHASDVNNKYTEFGNKTFNLNLKSEEDAAAAELVRRVYSGEMTLDEVTANYSVLADKVKAAIAASGRQAPTSKKTPMFNSNNPLTFPKK
jgi:hypothetical protein